MRVNSIEKMRFGDRKGQKIIVLVFTSNPIIQN